MVDSKQHVTRLGQLGGTAESYLAAAAGSCSTPACLVFGHLMLHSDDRTACPVAATLREQRADLWESKGAEDNRLSEGLCLRADNIWTAEPRRCLHCGSSTSKCTLGPATAANDDTNCCGMTETHLAVEVRRPHTHHICRLHLGQRIQVAEHCRAHDAHTSGTAACMRAHTDFMHSSRAAQMQTCKGQTRQVCLQVSSHLP